LAKLKAHRPELIAALAGDETDEFNGRSAIIEYDGGIPRKWAEGYARLDPNRPPGDVPLKRWQRFVDDVGKFRNADRGAADISSQAECARPGIGVGIGRCGSALKLQRTTP
jgi:hypothetical protein